MDILNTNQVPTCRLRLRADIEIPGHPWFSEDQIEAYDAETTFPCSVSLLAADGSSLGTGVFDPRDPDAAWRRFSWEEGAVFDASYIGDAINAALGRRSDEACQRLIASDADYLPGLVVEIYGDVLVLEAQTAAVDAHLDAIVEMFSEIVGPREIVLRNSSPRREAFGLDRVIRTQSGQNLKGFWAEIDSLQYRLDPLNAEKPGFYLDQREQHALVGSLCEGRRVLDGFANQGAFALQAARCEAIEVVAVDISNVAVKTLGASAQKNGLKVQAVEADIADYLKAAEAGAFDGIVLDPPEAYGTGEYVGLLQEAFRVLGQGGLLAVYCRDVSVSADAFQGIVSRAAATQGREGRIFARTGQPFDFPSLLNFPESGYLKGLILQVE